MAYKISSHFRKKTLGKESEEERPLLQTLSIAVALKHSKKKYVKYSKYSKRKLLNIKKKIISTALFEVRRSS